MHAESRILLLTAGNGRNDSALRTLLDGPVDWDLFLVLAEWERTLPWSWRRVSATGATAPPEAVESLEKLSRVCEFHSMVLEERLEQLLRAFGEAGIRAILLKGAAIAMSAYRSFAERPMGDLDLLVSPADATRAWEIALENGWTWDRDAFPREHYKAHHHLPPLYDATRTGVKLELHTGLSLSSHPYALSFDEALQVSHPLEAYPGAFVLDKEHTVIHLAVHFAWAHLASFGMWRLARDLGALSQAGLNWERVVELAERYRATESLYWSLRLSRVLCGLNAWPAWVEERLRPRRSAWLLGVLERHLSLHVIARIAPCPSEKWRRLMWSMALNPSRTATSAMRPWDSEPASKGSMRGLGLLERIRLQLRHGRAWRRYFSLLRSAS